MQKESLSQFKRKWGLIFTVLTVACAGAFLFLRSRGADFFERGALPLPSEAPRGRDNIEASRSFAKELAQIAERKRAELPPAPKTFPKIKDRKEFEKKYGNDWTFKENDNGKVTWIYGADIPVGEVTPERILELTRSLGPFFGLKQDNIGAPGRLLADDGSMPQDYGTRVVQFQRMYKGYPVIDSTIQVGVDLGTKSVFSIQLSGPAPRGPLATQIKDVAQIQKSVQSKGIKISKGLNSPEIFQSQGGQARLVYRGTKDMQNSADISGRLVLVDAITAEILGERPAGFVD